MKSFSKPDNGNALDRKKYRRSRGQAGLTAGLLLLAGSVLPTGVLYAVSQNEVLTTVLFDGESGFSATEPTAPTGTAPEAHTRGLDGSANNLVVRTYDRFGVRIAWNVMSTNWNKRVSRSLGAGFTANFDATKGNAFDRDRASGTYPIAYEYMGSIRTQNSGFYGRRL